MSQPSRRRLRVETTGETGRVGDDCVSQWVKVTFKTQQCINVSILLWQHVLV